MIYHVFAISPSNGICYVYYILYLKVEWRMLYLQICESVPVPLRGDRQATNRFWSGRGYW